MKHCRLYVIIKVYYLSSYIGHQDEMIINLKSFGSIFPMEDIQSLPSDFQTRLRSQTSLFNVKSSFENKVVHHLLLLFTKLVKIS